MNNKGQSLVLFVVIMPIILLMFVLVYDIGNAMYEKNKLSNVSYMVIDYALDNMDTTQVKTSSSTPTQNNDDFFKNCENEVKSEEAENVLGRRKRRRSMSSSNNITNTTTNGNKENKFRTPVNKEYSEDTITKSC